MAFKLNLILGLCLLAAAGCQGERIRYDNYRIYKAIASMPAQMKVLKNLEAASDSIMFLDDFNPLNKAINVVVAPHKVPDFLEILGTNEVDFKLIDNNLQRHLEDDKKHVAKSFANGRAVNYDWTQYYQLNDTYNWLQQLAIDNPGVVTVIEGGRSYQGRSIMGVKITKSKLEKPGIFVEAGTHAREWIAPATATYLINQLLTSNNTAIKDIAQNYTWYILPHTNPDGFVYTHTTDRMWRKTRTPYGNCFGADPNRNWDIQWNTIDPDDMPCSYNYAGPSAFSEIETRSLSQYIGSLRDKMSLYISFHANYQKLLYPYGYTSALPANYQDLKQVFGVSIAALEKRYGTEYTGGNIYHNIYPVSGASIDWVYADGTKMAFCYELRPPKGGPYRFDLPANQIIPTGEETVDSIVAMVNEVQKLGYFK